MRLQFTAVFIFWKITQDPTKNVKGILEYSEKYRSIINTYNSRFERLLKADREFYEDKQLFSNGISSKNMGDVKKRYW